MPNYRYHTPDYMHRNGCSRPAPAPQPAAPCTQTAIPCNQTAAPFTQTDNTPVCCSDTSKYDDLSGMSLAMAYVPWQEWQNIYEAEKGFHCGTIFEELNMPFNGIRMGGCCK